MDYEGHIRDLVSEDLNELTKDSAVSLEIGESKDRRLEELERLQSKLRDDEILVSLEDATEKQKKDRRVSTKDTRSVLGKKLKQHRKNKKASKQSKKNNRR